MLAAALVLLAATLVCLATPGVARVRGANPLRRRAPETHRLPLQLSQADGEPVRLLVDTDAGVDDAFALLLALGSPGVTVEAVTCVNGNTALDNVVANVLKTLHTAGRLDIPVYAGSSQSILETPETDNYFGEDGFGDIDYPDAPDPAQYLQHEHAVDALVRIVTENPGNMTLVSLGPVTNIALAIRKDATFLRNLKQIAVMGGSVEGVGNRKPGIEFNIFMDPEAAHIVFSSLTEDASLNKQILLTPWETAEMRNLITLEWRKDVLGTVNSTQMVLLNEAEHYQLETNTTYWTSIDPIATAVLLKPQLITRAGEYSVLVEVQGEHSRGALFVDYAESEGLPKNSIIVQDFNVEAYKTYLLKALS